MNSQKANNFWQQQIANREVSVNHAKNEPSDASWSRDHIALSDIKK